MFSNFSESEEESLTKNQ